MRYLAPLLLAGLLAWTAQPASALCADDGNGGCSAMRHDWILALEACPDDASRLCLVAPEAVDAHFVPSGGILNLTITNRLEVPADLELFVTARLDDANADTSDPSADRVRADRILVIEALQPGETRVVEVALDGNVAQLRVQGLSSDGRHGELDAEATPIMALTAGGPEPAQQEDVVAPGKDAPSLGLMLLVAALGLATAFVALRRIE